jgi:hypothetical protein
MIGPRCQGGVGFNYRREYYDITELSLSLDSQSRILPTTAAENYLAAKHFVVILSGPRMAPTSNRAQKLVKLRL